MQHTSYYIDAGPEKFSLAEASWQAFRPFLSRYQWSFDHPSHSPRATEIAHAILNSGKPGCCTFSRPQGFTYKLKLLHDWAVEDAITNHRKIYYVSFGKQALLYFDIDLHYAWQTWADGEGAKSLIEELLCRFFGQSVLFWSLSSRGFNGYLKVDLQGASYTRANDLFGRLETALRLYLAHHHNLADFEIKGRIGHLSGGEYVWAQYGKLPIHATDWNFARLSQFKTTPTVPLRALKTVCDNLEGSIPTALLSRHKLYKKSLGDAPFVENGFFRVTPDMEKALTEKHGEEWPYLFPIKEDQDGKVWLSVRHYRPGCPPLTEAEVREALRGTNQGQAESAWPTPHEPDSIQNVFASIFERLDAAPAEEAERRRTYALLFERLETEISHNERNQLETHRLVQRAGRTVRPGTDEQEPGGDRTAAPGASTCRDAGRDHRLPGVFVDDLLAEPDSRKRQHEALLRLSRHLKRVPTLDEGLAFIKEKSLFTDPWDQQSARRKTRVRDILKFIARTFDANKCANGSVNVGKYDAWAREKFPKGLSGNLADSIDEYGQRVSGKNLHIGPDFIGVFLAVAEFTLLIDKNEDGSLPHRRGEELWHDLHAKGLIPMAFNANKWKVCREELDKHGVIKIVDRNYGHGRAMKWAPGAFFPFLGLWKAPKLPSLLGPVDPASFLAGRRGETKEEHNTLLQTDTPRAAVSGRSALPRPPPA